MNKNKSSNLLRLIAFFLTSVILVCTFGFTVDGWNQVNSDDNGGQNPMGNNNTPNNTTDETDSPTESLPVLFYNKLTGLETTEELANLAPVAYVMEKNAPLFGLSGADVIIDIPTEGDNRLVTIRTDNTSLWKIGSIAPTRGYISNFANFFGAALLSYGSDEIMKQDSSVPDASFDLTNYSYKEYDDYFYTNSDLIAPLFEQRAFDAVLPYSFVDQGEFIPSATSANRISFEECELKYSEESAAYFWFENGVQVRDLINGKTISFSNCLVLFSDSVIYDNSSGCQMVMSTIGSGIGYYATNGQIYEIKWTSTSSGIMSFFTADGQPLQVNRGNIYIRILKSSMADDINIF